MLTTDPSSGRVIRWVPYAVAYLACAAGLVVGATAGYATGNRHDAALRTECKQAISITEELITNLESWMQFAHTTEHGAD